MLLKSSIFLHIVSYFPKDAAMQNWTDRIGRRLKLHDLHILFAVVQCGSMAKAARQLGVSQPAISEIVADLEHALGVRLLDRHSWGIEPTIYGEAVLKRSTAVFDELKQSIRDVEFLADPTTGEIRIGCVESLSVTILPQIALRFSQQYPRVVLNVDDLTAPAIDLPGLRDRKYDCILVRLVTPLPGYPLADDLNAELLFDDRLVVAAGANSRWTRRRKIDLAELVDEPWILAPPGTWHHVCMAEAFRALGLGLPKASMISLSVTLRTQLMAAGPYISVFGVSVMRLNASRYNITVLPIELPIQPWPAVLVTLKNRTLSPVVERFIACAREVAKSFAIRPQARR
jgi:DNA-binding transcriptional LysR family regulator